MSEATAPTVDPYRFISENIESVPQLEALMLLWNSRPVAWTLEELSSRLYIAAESAEVELTDLIRLGLIAKVEEPQLKYRYLSQSKKQDEMMAEVDLVYRRELVRVSTMIHSKASSSVREFSRAFRFKKEKE